MGRINRALAAAAQSGLIELWHACLGPLLFYLMMMIMILMAIILTMKMTIMMCSLDILNCGTLVLAHYYHHHSYELSIFMTRNAANAV